MAHLGKVKYTLTSFWAILWKLGYVLSQHLVTLLPRWKKKDYSLRSYCAQCDHMAILFVQCWAF